MNKKKILLATLSLICVLVVGIGFAAISRNLFIAGTAMFELGYLIAKGQEVYFQEQPQDELISSLITEKFNICSPERLCEILIMENEMWNSREWFDKYHKYEPDFSFEK